MQFDQSGRRDLLRTNAAAYARSGLENINREYPVHLWWIPDGPGEIPSHRMLHPVFFGSFDWHSCVEMYWVQVCMLKLDPGFAGSGDVRTGIDELLTVENVAIELGFFHKPNCRNFERPYGWGWLLTLAAELHDWDDDHGSRWFQALRPLADHLARSFVEWLPKQTYPVRSGMHNNTAFGLLRSLRYAQILADEGDSSLTNAISEAAMRWYLHDEDYPAHYEPSGADFLSAALSEAELMGSLLPTGKFNTWFTKFLPGCERAEPREVFQPVVSSDHADGQLAHLEGLNLSRAASFLALAKALPDGDARAQVMEDAARIHADASLGAVIGGDYMLEHWLSAYATLLLRA